MAKTECFTKLSAYCSRRETAVRSVLVLCVPVGEELSLLLAVHGLSVELLAMERDSLFVQLGRTLLNAVIGGQTVEALLARTRPSQGLGHGVVLSEREAQKILVLVLVSGHVPALGDGRLAHFDLIAHSIDYKVLVKPEALYSSPGQ